MSVSEESEVQHYCFHVWQSAKTHSLKNMEANFFSYFKSFFTVFCLCFLLKMKKSLNSPILRLRPITIRNGFLPTLLYKYFSHNHNGTASPRFPDLIKVPTLVTTLFENLPRE